MAFKRNIFFRVNKFQWVILFYLASLGLSCLVLMILFLSYLYVDFNNFIHSFPCMTIKICILVALPLTAVLILLSCFYLYHLTNKMFGPYERILQEIDKVVKTGEKKQIFLRKGDEMFQDLVDQLNCLIQRLP